MLVRRLKLWLTLQLLVFYVRRYQDRPYADMVTEIDTRAFYPYRRMTPLRYMLAHDTSNLLCTISALRFHHHRFDRWCISVTLLLSVSSLRNAARHAYLDDTEIQRRRAFDSLDFD